MTVLVRHREEVIKTMTAEVADSFFAHALSGGAEAVRRYAAGLHAAGVTLPEDLAITQGAQGPEVRYRWIGGPTLLELPAWRSAEFTSAVMTIADWVRVLEPASVRLDTNLANFVIPDGENLVCVDVLPPLLVPSRPPGTGPWEQVIGGLCFDTDITLCAVAGYAIRHLLRVLGPAALDGTCWQSLAGVCPGHPQPASLAARWFHSRLHAARLAAAGQLPPERAASLFSATSVRALRQTAPGLRAARAAVALSLASATLETRQS